MRHFGLIGYPLTHSFSEKYFARKFKQEGLENCSYSLFPIRSISEIETILRHNPGLEGLNVTIPYKSQVLEYLDSRAGIPEGLNACNCIRIRNGHLSGFNTDFIAFRQSLEPLLGPVKRKALVLGSGGAAAAVCFALGEMGIPFRIVSRNPGPGQNLAYDQLTEALIREHNLIINTTPLGMYPDTAAFPLIPYSFITGDHVLYDLVYNPEKTVFLRHGEEKGAVIKNGMEMLERQAEESWRIWNS
ncbi:MAG: shikimate dehydrogenase family protein [Chitinophagaceae bacterium]